MASVIAKPQMEKFRILGIVLVRNEDLYVRCAIRNIVAACDEVLVLDHQSKDRTPGILRELEAEFANVRVRTIKRPSESHDAIESYAGKNYWIFAVDGDEIYDPVRTRELFESMREGRYSEYYRLRGNVLHCTSADADRYEGHLAPPSRSMTKLYNFSFLEKWTGGFERLHGGEIVFREGCSARKVLNLYEGYGFEDAPFRCLHLVFLKRSSLDREGSGPRLNIADRLSRGFFGRWKDRVRGWFGRSGVSAAKYKNYALGERVVLTDPAFGLVRETYLSRSQESGVRSRNSIS